MAYAERELHTGEWLRHGKDELVHHLAGDGVDALARRDILLGCGGE